MTATSTPPRIDRASRRDGAVVPPRPHGISATAMPWNAASLVGAISARAAWSLR